MRSNNRGDEMQFEVYIDMNNENALYTVSMLSAMLETQDGDYCNTNCMNLFLQMLSEAYPEDIILLCCDGAAWHKSGAMNIPKNIELFFIPPYTPEMNPIEQIWKELRQIGFRNEVFATLDKVVDRLCNSINRLTKQTIQSITGRQWISGCFN